MPRNEEGEFELVLGNRQLLSVFFIMVVLLGVFFMMGYIVGRNSAPGSELAKRGEAASAIVVDKQADTAKPEPSKGLAPGQAEVTTPAAPVAAKPAAAPPSQAKPEKPAEAKPAEKAPEKAVAKTDEKKAPTPPKAEPKPETRPAAPPTPTPVAGPIVEPSKGTTWLQLMAVARTDAEMMVNTLRKKGFSATMAPSTKEPLFRVLVGPLADSAAVSRTRADLAAAGFKAGNVVKY